MPRYFQRCAHSLLEPLAPCLRVIWSNKYRVQRFVMCFTFTITVLLSYWFSLENDEYNSYNLDFDNNTHGCIQEVLGAVAGGTSASKSQLSNRLFDSWGNRSQGACGCKHLKLADASFNCSFNNKHIDKILRETMCHKVCQIVDSDHSWFISLFYMVAFSLCTILQCRFYVASEGLNVPCRSSKKKPETADEGTALLELGNKNTGAINSLTPSTQTKG